LGFSITLFSASSLHFRWKWLAKMSSRKRGSHSTTVGSVSLDSVFFLSPKQTLTRGKQHTSAIVVQGSADLPSQRVEGRHHQRRSRGRRRHLGRGLAWHGHVQEVGCLFLWCFRVFVFNTQCFTDLMNHGVGRALLGSTSDHCVHNCSCPVLVYKPSEQQK